MKFSSVMIILIFTLLILFIGIRPVCADSIMCEKGVASSGDSKGVVMHKCGQPIYIAKDKIINTGDEWKAVEKWTYIISGCYREFIFTGSTLDKIIDGSLVQ